MRNNKTGKKKGKGVEKNPIDFIAEDLTCAIVCEAVGVVYLWGNWDRNPNRKCISFCFFRHTGSFSRISIFIPFCLIFYSTHSNVARFLFYDTFSYYYSA